MSISTSDFLRRTLIVLGIGALAVVLYDVLHAVFGVLLILFGGVLLAVLIDGLARLLSRHTPLSRGVSVALVLFVATGLIAAAVWFLGPRIAAQGGELAERLPETMTAVEAWLRQFGWGTAVAEQMPDSAREAMPESAPIGAVTTAFSTVFGALANVLIILFVGIYLAVEPSLYVSGVVRLVPKPHRPRAEEVIAAIGSGLRRWLLGRIASMTVVGVLTAVGLLLFGIPLALTLGLLAALLSFVPYIGPILALVPALAVALGEGSQTVVTVLAIYLAVQFAESYLITPLIQKRAVSMPPALLIASQVVLGVLAGAVGVAVATPLVVVAVIAIEMLYVEDVLGDDVEVMGGGEG
ncbi:MAG: AI-2E family transporter [Rhodothermales bacterium]